MNGRAPGRDEPERTAHRGQRHLPGGSHLNAKRRRYTFLNVPAAVSLGQSIARRRIH